MRLIIMPRSVCISRRRSFPRSRRKCIRHMRMGVFGNMDCAAEIMPDLMSHVIPDGSPNLSFTTRSTAFMDSSDSELHLSTWRTKSDMESLTATIMEKSESVVPSICSMYDLRQDLSLSALLECITGNISSAVLLSLLTCLSDMPLFIPSAISELLLPSMYLLVADSSITWFA